MGNLRAPNEFPSELDKYIFEFELKDSERNPLSWHCASYSKWSFELVPNDQANVLSFSHFTPRKRKRMDVPRALVPTTGSTELHFTPFHD